MFSFLKNFLRKPADEPAEEAAVMMAPAAPAHTSPNGFVPVARHVTATPVARNTGPKGIEVSLQTILSTLPLELQPRIIQREVGAVTINVPLDVVLSQLSRGAVNLNFGQLRQAAPYVFSPEPDRDKTPVPLPLSEIVAKLNPNLMTCRRVQRQIEVPSEIVSPFETAGQSVVFTTSAPAAAPAPAPAPAPVPVASVRQTTPVIPSSIPAAPIPMRSTLTSAPTPPPPAAAPIPAPAILNHARPVAEPAPKSPLSYTAQPAPPAAKPAPSEALMIGLIALAEGWPEGIRQEIVHLNLVDAKVALPVDVVEQGLRQGKLAFGWKTVRSWIKNTAVAPISAQDSVVLELPLKVVAPLFLARKKEASREQQKVNVNTDIPNLFFGFPQAESSVAGPVAKPVDTNYYVWDDASDTAHVNLEETKRPATSPGTRFISKCATPNEVVSRAEALEGVAGALVALPDGLMVASRLSSDLNGDTLAAFLPHIFGKVTQCTKELRMGELNNLSFTVGNVPWKIFRVNAIFFAAFGRAGQGLPGQQLAALASELDHRNK